MVMLQIVDQIVDHVQSVSRKKMNHALCNLQPPLGLEAANNIYGPGALKCPRYF